MYNKWVLAFYGECADCRAAPSRLATCLHVAACDACHGVFRSPCLTDTTHLVAHCCRFSLPRGANTMVRGQQQGGGRRLRPRMTRPPERPRSMLRGSGAFNQPGRTSTAHTSLGLPLPPGSCPVMSPNTLAHRRAPAHCITHHMHHPCPALPRRHMFFCSALAILLVKLGYVESINMTTETYIKAVVPIGGLYAGTLWLGNAAYLYLSVSFIQMLKVGAPWVCVMWVWVCS